MFNRQVFAKSILTLAGLTAGGSTDAAPPIPAPASPDSATSTSKQVPATMHCAITQYIQWARAQSKRPDPDVKARKLQEIDEICGSSLHLAHVQSSYETALGNAAVVTQSRPPNTAAPDAARNPGAVSAGVTAIDVKQAIDAGSLRVASAAVATPDGGFLITGGYRADQYNRNVFRQFYLKISGAPSITWEQTYASDWRNPAPAAVYLLADGGYWTLGTRFAKDVEAEQRKAQLAGLGASNPYKAITENEFDAISPINNAGASLPVIMASTIGTTQNVSCGTELKDGFVLVGFNTNPQGGSWLGAIPLIEKVDKSGRLMWIHEFPQDQGQAIDVTDQIQRKPCNPPIAGADGAITTSINVKIRPVTHSAAEWVKAVSHPGVLIIKLDANGNEVARVRHDNVSDGFLLPSNAGFDLLERNVPLYPAPGSVPLAQALVEINRLSALGSITRVTRFDGLLRSVVNTAEYKTGALETIKAAYRTPEGGILLAGCPVAGGNNYVVHIGPSGIVSPPLQISPNQGMQQCSMFVFSGPAHPGEALIFVSNDIVGGRVITLRYGN